MSFKFDLAPRSLPLLPAVSLLRADGPDAGTFLQAQTMNDVASLVPGQWQWNGWLNPKGRVIALFALWRTGADGFLLLLPDFPASALLPGLQRFVLRARVRLQVETGLCAAAAFGAALHRPDAPANMAQAIADDAWLLDMAGETARQLLLLPTAHPALAPACADGEERWRVQDMAHGLPRLPAEPAEAWTPQMLSLQRLQAFSLRKGCYPGQEIVARTHYLGQGKRSLLRLLGRGLAPGAAITDSGGRPLGEVVCCAAGGSEALAVLPPAPPADGRFCQGEPVQPLPLLGGLQR